MPVKALQFRIFFLSFFILKKIVMSTYWQCFSCSGLVCWVVVFFFSETLQYDRFGYKILLGVMIQFLWI